MSDEDRGGGRIDRDAGYDEWLDALEVGEGFYLRCPDDHGSFPPRRVCPECGSTELREHPLPDAGPVESFTVVHVATPRFADDAPYVTAIAAFEAVRLTGLLRGVEPSAVDVGLPVAPTVERTETDGDRVVVFRPAS